MTTAIAGAPARPAAAPNPWLVTVTLMVGTLAAVMGSSTINTALPDIMAGVSIPGDQVSWVSTAYMLANVIAIPSAAWLGNLLSKRILFGVGMLVFLSGSIACGMSWDFSSMVACRVLQGLGAGLVMPVAQSMMLEAFPPEKRGMAMGIYGMGAIMGPAIGPTVGGYLVSVLGWRSIFFLNIPFGLTSLALLGVLPRAPRRPGLKFDAPGFAFMVLFLSTLQIAVSNGSKDGWDAPYILACVVTSAVSLIALLYRELTTPEPLLELRVFKSGLYNLSTLVSVIMGLGLYGATFLVPLYLGNLQGYTALHIGLLLLPGSLAMGLMMLVAGRLSDLIDSRLLLVLGLVVFGYGLHMQSLADMSSPDSLHMWAQLYRGLGIGLCFSPLTALSLRGMPPGLLAQATGLFNLTRQLAGSIGIAAINTVLTSRAAHHALMLQERMPAESPPARQFLQSAKAMLIARGMPPSQADLGAYSLLGGQIKLQIQVLAYADIFYIVMIIVMAGLVPVLFLRSRPA